MLEQRGGLSVGKDGDDVWPREIFLPQTYLGAIVAVGWVASIISCRLWGPPCSGMRSGAVCGRATNFFFFFLVSSSLSPLFRCG